MECTIKIVDDIGRDDFLSQTKDGDVFSGYYANAKHTPVYCVNANYTDGKFQFNRCFYFDENDKVVFILTWFAYEYNS